jgi:hypothetical protein
MGMESPDIRPSWADDSYWDGAARLRCGGSVNSPASGGFFVALKCKGNHMYTPSRQWPEWLRLIADDGFTVSILAVVVVVCLFAFGFGAAYELIAALLILGVVTAVVEARLHAKKRR